MDGNGQSLLNTQVSYSCDGHNEFTLKYAMIEWGFRPLLCTKLGQDNIHPENGEINLMTLPSRHRIRNLSLGGMMPSMALYSTKS